MLNITVSHTLIWADARKRAARHPAAGPENGDEASRGYLTSISDDTALPEICAAEALVVISKRAEKPGDRKGPAETLHLGISVTG